MVSEPVVEDATTETTDDASEEVAVEIVEATIGDTPTVASEAEEVTPDASDDAIEVTEPEPFPTTVTELREKFPELAQAAEYAGAQSREATLRREMGSAANAAARLNQYKEHLQANPDDDGKAVAAILQDNRLNVQDELTRAFAKESAAAQGWDQVQIDAMNVTIDKMSGTDLTQYANQVINQGLDAREARVRAELGAENDAVLAKRLGEEMAAREIESKPKKTDPPTTPAGGAPGSGTFADVTWVKAQMDANPNWLHEVDASGKSNLQKARPAIDALAQTRKKQRTE